MHTVDSADDDDRPSRSARRRDALGVLAFARRLSELPAARLDQLRLPDAVREQLAQLQHTPSHIARKRELGHLARVLRVQADADLAFARASIDDDRAATARAAAALHRIESVREALMDEHGDDALAALIAGHPAADHQRLRALVRQARREREAAKPPRSQRELFRLLRSLLDGEAGA